MAIDYSITKSYDMYFRDFYSIDRNASKSEQRASYKTNKLAKADSSAMTKISKTLRKMDFSPDNGNDIFYTVKSFVNAYNNLMESSSMIYRILKNLSKVLQKTRKRLFLILELQYRHQASSNWTRINLWKLNLPKLVNYSQKTVNLRKK